MGVHQNIRFDKFPKQGEMLGKRVKVCFFYDANNTIDGECVRDDMEEPFRTIFKLDNGNYVLATECQFQGAD